MRIRSLRPRSLLVSMALVAFVGLLIPAVLMGLLSIGSFEARAVAAHQQQAMSGRLDALATSLPALLWNVDTAAAAPVIDAVMASPEVVRVTVTDDIQKNVFLRAERPERRHGATETAQRALTHGGARIGLVTMEVDDSEFAATLRAQRTLYGITLGAQVIVSLALIVWLLNERVVRPVRRLGSFALDLAKGHFETRAPTPGHDEIGQLTERLIDTRDNLQALFDKQQRLIETVRLKESDVRRLSDFYAALSRSNQAISRTRDEDRLLREICQICVDVGHVAVASISMPAGDRAARHVLVGADPERLAQLASAREAGMALPVSDKAMRDGRRTISDDIGAEYGHEPSGALAQRFGIRSVAAFALRRSGRVVGVLSLYAEKAAFFDREAADLFEELAQDLSNALDRLDHEAERVLALHEAKTGLERFSRLFHGAPVSMSIVAAIDGRVIDVNDAFCERWGKRREQLIGQLESEAEIGWMEEDRKKYQALLASDYRVRNFVGRIRSTSGQVREALFNGELIEYRGQLCTLTTTVDLSVIRESEIAREAQRVAEAGNRAKTEFIARMSHELRTPLNAVLGFSQLLLQQTASRLQQGEVEQLEHIELAGRHLLHLIDDVLDVAKVEGGHLGVESHSLPLKAAIELALKMSESAARQQGAILAPPVCPPDLSVVADPLRLQQVLLNLLSNAIKYNRPGGYVRVKAQADGPRVLLEIADTGLGMTAEQLRHLYEPFNRLGRERGGIEGTGVGLTLTRHLVRLMGGELDIASQPGAGTRARVALAAGDQTHPVPDLLPSETTRAEPPTDAVVLYIEDNPVNLLLVQQMLSAFDRVELMPAEDGTRGLQVARSAHPDLILLDMQLPDMDGLQVLDELRSEPWMQGVPVVAVSASAMPEEVERARRHGITEYWTKPLDLGPFLAGVARLLRPRDATASPSVGQPDPLDSTLPSG